METTNSCTGTGGAGGEASAHFTLTGTSTYYWQWVPPNNAAGQPDLANFPAPPLFVLGKGEGVLNSTLVSSPNAAGLTVSGSASADIGSGGTRTISACPAFQSWTDCAVLTPTRESATLDKLLLSPSVTYDATGVSVTNPGQYPPQMGGESQNWTGVRDDLYPITLYAPNPLKNPELGDGYNQEVYDSSLPGRINIPAVISVLGASSADTAWLVSGNHVDVAIVPAISGQEPHTWSAFENFIGLGPGYFTFDGLPTQYNGSADDPNSFGNHEAILKVNASNSQFAHFQTFFTANAINWPNSNGITPNWFHYYNQLRPFPGLYVPSLGAAGQCTTFYLFNHNTKEYIIVGDALSLGSSAAQYSPVPVFEIAPNGFIRTAGTVKLKGVLSYIYVCGHELGHEAAQTQRVEVPYIDNTPPAGVVDVDGDGIPDSWEIAHHLDPNDPDTAGYYGQMSGPDAGKGDRESLATMIGLGQLQTYSNLWQHDWADVGVQYGLRSRFVPFEYDPYDISQYPASSLPADALTDWP